tara:strand:+ start:520 stop:975 length:456 start_codon:yes stop_codon:yes gene_type:complete
MKLVSVAPSKRITGHSPVVQKRRASDPGNKNAVCRVVGTDGKTYMTIRLKPGSRSYKGRKANDLSFHLVFSSTRYLMELQHKGLRLDGRPTTAAVTDPKSIQAVVTKFNANAIFSKHFIATANIPAAEEVAFDSNFTGTGRPFRGGRGVGR